MCQRAAGGVGVPHDLKTCHDVMQEDISDVRDKLINQLVLLEPPSFMYAAQPPAASNRHRKRSSAALSRSAGDSEDDESATVYGSYAAVTLCDCRWGLCCSFSTMARLECVAVTTLAHHSV